MIASTAYHELCAQLQNDLVSHGWGEMTFRVTSLKDNTVKVEILCGKSFVFFIEKKIEFNPKHLL